jgi:hypothetical protein
MSTHAIHTKGEAVIATMMRERGLDVRIRKAGRRRFVCVTGADGRTAVLRVHVLSGKPTKSWQINDITKVDEGIEPGRATFWLLGDFTGRAAGRLAGTAPGDDGHRASGVQGVEGQARRHRPKNRQSPHVRVERERVTPWANRLDLLPPAEPTRTP